MSEVIFGEKYVTEADRSFTVAEKKGSLSGDSFDITDQDGNKVFKGDGNSFVKTKMMSLIDSETKDILCQVGKDKETGGFHVKKGETYQVMYLFKPESGFSNTDDVSSKIEIFYGGSGAYPSYFITRIIDEKTFAVMDAGKNTEVGRISHSIRTGHRDVWTTSVPAGVDAAFMVACTMLVDEILESKM